MLSAGLKQFSPSLKDARHDLQSFRSGKLRWPTSCSNIRKTVVNVAAAPIRVKGFRFTHKGEMLYLIHPPVEVPHA
jgi:hypothetical protein